MGMRYAISGRECIAMRRRIQWLVDDALVERFMSESRQAGIKPNVALAFLMQYWLEVKLPELRDKMRVWK
jgi:hypothetical protein